MNKIVELKPNNIPTQTGFYLCLRKKYSTRPALIDVRLKDWGGEECLECVGEGLMCLLKDLNDKDVLWSDEIIVEGI